MAGFAIEIVIKKYINFPLLNILSNALASIQKKKKKKKGYISDKFAVFISFLSMAIISFSVFCKFCIYAIFW